MLLNHFVKSGQKPGGNQERCPSEGRWRNKLWYIQTMENYSTLKRNEVSSHEKIRRYLKCILLREANLKGRLLHDSNYMIFCKRQNYGDRKISGCQGLGGREEQAEHRGFLGSKITSHDTIIMGTCHYTFFQKQKTYSTKNDP